MVRLWTIRSQRALALLEAPSAGPQDEAMQHQTALLVGRKYASHSGHEHKSVCRASILSQCKEVQYALDGS